MLDQTFIEENIGFGGSGSLLEADGPDSEIELEGVQIWNNLAEVLLEARNAGHVFAGLSTAELNQFLNAGGDFDDSFGARALTGTANLISSIFRGASGYQGEVFGNCLMTQTSSGLLFDSQFSLEDPEFINRSTGNLHLRPTSPAIDYCDAIFNPTRLDIDLDQRGFDHANPDFLGRIDLGVDEAVGLFWDGFESGDTTVWSSTAP